MPLPGHKLQQGPQAFHVEQGDVIGMHLDQPLP
jgi:hypothetical protein